jgi:hypothetical protein
MSSNKQNWNEELERIKKKQFEIYDMAANIKEGKSRKTKTERMAKQS